VRSLPAPRQAEGSPQSVERRDQADPAAAADDKISCPLCASPNPRHLRFCTTCGNLLAAPSTRPVSPQRPASRPAPTEVQPSTIRPPPIGDRQSSVPPIPSSRVVELGAGAPEAMLLLCARCRGGSDPNSQFCRFCGASLADGSSVSLAPRTPPPPSVDASPRSAGVAGASPVPARPSPLPMRSTISMASPQAAPERARLVLIAQGGGEGPSHAIGDAADIGRSEGSIVVTGDKYVSPRHARVAARGGAYYLRDLGSTNGIFFRIPFERGGPREREATVDGRMASQNDRERERGRERERDQGDQESQGQGQERVGGGAQSILDQDLFLVGQQVLKFEVVKNAEEGFGVASEGGTLVFGTPTAPRYARLTQRTVEGVNRDIFHVQRLETIIGREIGDIVFTDDPFLSRRHAAIRVLGVGPNTRGQPRRFELADLGSSNGTFVQLREEIRLRDGDQFRIGQQLFRFDLDRTDA